MTILYEGRHPVSFILSLLPGYQSIEAVTIGASQTIQPGQLLGGKAVPASVTTAASVGTNTGNATIAMGSPETTSAVKNGRYKGIAVTATTVRWEDPEGNEIGTSTHGSAFTKGGIKFTITAGGTPNVAGDEFYVDVGVEPGDFEYVAYDPAGSGGAEVAKAIAMYPAVTGVGESLKISAISAGAEVNAKELVLPDGISAANLAKAYGELREQGIIVRN